MPRRRGTGTRRCRSDAAHGPSGREYTRLAFLFPQARRHIALIDGAGEHDDSSEEFVAQRLVAAHFLEFLVVKWSIGVYDLYLSKNAGVKNHLAVIPGRSIAANFLGSPATNYMWGYPDFRELRAREGRSRPD